MITDRSAARRARHQQLSAFLASYSDSELAALVDTGQANSVGVGGGSAVLDVDGAPVFAKRIPLTDLELAHPGSTANLFDVPVFCQYGVVSPGFNAWRELAANVIVTDGVLAGETQSFPLLYHWRVLPGRAPVAAEYADIDTVVAALGGSPTVRARFEALAAASSSLVLFCEYIPRSIVDWLREDPSQQGRHRRAAVLAHRDLPARSAAAAHGRTLRQHAHRRGTDLSLRLRAGHLAAFRPVRRRARLRRTPRHA
jgi:hypothetical protein